MIIACEKCKSTFQLEESLLRDKGSKVRCSLCRHVFTVYPTTSSSIEEAAPFGDVDEAMQETVALDSPPSLDDQEETDFDTAFEAALEKESIPATSFNDLPDEGDEISFGSSEGTDALGGIGADITEEGPDLAGLTDTEVGEKTVKFSSDQEKPHRKRRLVPFLLILLILVAAGVAIFFFKPSLIPESLHFLKPATKLEITDLGVSRLDFKAVSGSFVESKTAGKLFVIKGMITNNYPRTRSHIFIKGSLLDDQGKVVKRKVSYAGNSFTESELQDMSMGQIDEALKNKSAKDNMNVDVQPGGSIPIMVVFDGLPDHLSEFTVEAVSSAPGN